MSGYSDILCCIRSNIKAGIVIMKYRYYFLSIICTFLLCASACGKKQDDIEKSVERDLIVENSNDGFFELYDAEIGVHNEIEALDFLESFVGEDGEGFSIEEKPKDIQTIDDTVYYRFQKKYNDIPVYGNFYVCSTTEDKVDIVTFDPSDYVVIENDTMLTEEEAKILVAPNTEEGDDSISVRKYYFSDYEEKTLVLAYYISTGMDYWLVNAYDGSILLKDSYVSDVNQAVNVQLRGQNPENIFEMQVDYSDEKKVYSLLDRERKIEAFYVTTPNDKTKKWEDLIKNSTRITWSRVDEMNYFSAAEAFYNVVKCYDFYDKVLNRKGPDGNGEYPIEIYDNIGETSNHNFTNNAACAYGVEDEVERVLIGIKNDGSHTYAEDLDILGHEYTHSIEGFYEFQGNDEKSLKEGISDILGVMISGYYNSNNTNWNITVRDLENPQNTNNPVTYDDYVAGSEAHYNATIIGHAAYLMWQGDDEKKLSTINECSIMAELFYRGMMLLGNNATYLNYRECVELAARQMVEKEKLTEKQFECIKWAFEQSRIPSLSGGEVNSNESLSLLIWDGDKNYISNWNARIVDKNGKEIISLNENSNKKGFILSAGYYHIIVQDPNGICPDKTQILVVNEASDNNIKKTNLIEVNTSFNTSLQGVVRDQAKNGLSNVSVTITSLDDDGAIYKTETENDGSFAIRMPHGSYKLDFQKKDYFEKTVYQFVYSGNNQLESTIYLSNKKKEPSKDELHKAFETYTKGMGGDEIAFFYYDADMDGRYEGYGAIGEDVDYQYKNVKTFYIDDNLSIRENSVTEDIVFWHIFLQLD